MRGPPSRPESPRRLVAEWLAEAAAVLVPVACAGCGRADASVCPGCRLALLPAPGEVTVDGLRVHIGLEYAGTVAAVIGAVKERGRTDAVRALAPAMQAVLNRAVAGEREPPLLISMPSARAAVRRRGFRPVDALVRASGHAVPLRPLLALARAIDDQAGLSAAQRQDNLAGAMIASARLRGRRVVLVDDVLTTGSTLREARRAVLGAGGEVTGAACLAYTVKRKVSGRDLTGDSPGHPY